MKALVPNNKVKFCASSVAGKEGTLYCHFIHQRNQRKLFIGMFLRFLTILRKERAEAPFCQHKQYP